MDTDTPTPAAPRRDIQGLRALAVVAVIGAHAAGWPAGGVLGVDVFFVISGFLITGMLLREARGSGSIRLAGFYARRARRLLPAALVVLIAVATAGWFLFNRTRGEQTLWDAAWAAALVSNWTFAAQGTDYFADTGAVSPLQHFWSLAVVVGSATALSLVRWAENYHLFLLGLVSLSAATVGRSALRQRWGRWPILHVMGMGLSYIAMLTAFYVDNGKNLPLWRVMYIVPKVG